MKTSIKVLIVAGVVMAAAGAVALKQRSAAKEAEPVAAVTNAEAGVGVKAALPRLVDLGSDKCIPCKQMAPILEELKKEYAGRMEVEFIDVRKIPELGKAFNIELIPTQIFYNASGKELFRHVGFFGKEDILAQWKELGVDLASGEKK